MKLEDKHGRRFEVDTPLGEWVAGAALGVTLVLCCLVLFAAY